MNLNQFLHRLFPSCVARKPSAHEVEQIGEQSVTAVRRPWVAEAHDVRRPMTDMEFREYLKRKGGA